VDALDITALIRDTDLTTVRDRITEEARSWSQLAIELTIAVRVTGMVACIMSGNLVTGHGGMVRKSGSVAITSREDINLGVGCMSRTRASDVHVNEELFGA
jgi:hypothetical protein